MIFFSSAGLDFVSTSEAVTLPANQRNARACITIPLLNDSIALEQEENFRVSFELLGDVDADGGLTLNNGRAVVLPGLRDALVAISDQNGKLQMLQ